MEILASRVLLRPADYQRSLRFYRDEIGLEVARNDAGAIVVRFVDAEGALGQPHELENLPSDRNNLLPHTAQ